MEEKNVSVSDMMNARESRAFLQQKLMREHPGSTLMCLCLNIAGPVKNGRSIRCFFHTVMKEAASLIPPKDIILCRVKDDFTGPEAIWCTDFPPQVLKERAIKLEDSAPAMRLLDIDIIDSSLHKISREDMGAPRRKCLLCGNDAVLCARSRTHSAAELYNEASQRISDYLAEKFISETASAAQEALLTEAAVSPKPGLVDRLDSGAHTDMDIFTFIRSACSLRDYFAECVRTGMMFCGKQPEECFRALRFPGILAEGRMMEATGNVNTHKGAVFSMGIICAALGMEFDGCTSDTEKALELCGTMTEADMRREMAAAGIPSGENGGIRSEAAAGFPTIRKCSLPCFAEMLDKGMSVNDAGLVTLLQLMAVTWDTNLIHRGGEKGLSFAQNEAQMLLRQIRDMDKEELHRRMSMMNREFIQRNLSPGGSADLLAITIMMHSIGKKCKENTDDI